MVTLWRSTKGELFSRSPDRTPVALKFHRRAAGMWPALRQASLALDYEVGTEWGRWRATSSRKKNMFVRSK